jgi:riboflavin kinase/FMN adenylyltransferase
MDIRGKSEALRAAGADRVELLEPTRELLSQEPEAFIKRLIEGFHPVGLVEGHDFRFGKDRRGDEKLLRAAGERHGFQVEMVEPVAVPLSDQMLTPVSSTLVRWLLSHGRVFDAARCLGTDYELTAPVVAGRQVGRSIGTHTANLDLSALPRLIPADGVYAGTVRLRDNGVHPAAISVGSQPTFEGQTRSVEAHLLDYHGDLYGQVISVAFSRWVRDQRKFPDTEALKQQIHRDIETTRRWQKLGYLRTVNPDRLVGV